MMPPQPSGGFAWVQASAGPALVCEPLAGVAQHIFTTRAWRLGSVDSAGTAAGWAEVTTAVGVAPPDFVRAHQVHGAAVIIAEAGTGDRLPPADIIVTRDPAVAVAVQAADCVPLLIADRRTGAIAAAHAGWRGLAVRVPEVAVEALTREFGSRPDDLVAAIGPSIGACCYEVGAEVRDAFVAAKWTDQDVRRWFYDRPQSSEANPSMPGVAAPRADHWFMDGWAIARTQLERAGVPADQIHTAALCTASHPEWLCSYRRDGSRAGRLAAAVR